VPVTPPSALLLPQGVDLADLQGMFGQVTYNGDRAMTFAFDPKGPVTKLWMAHGEATGEWPQLAAVSKGSGGLLFRFDGGYTVLAPASGPPREVAVLDQPMKEMCVPPYNGSDIYCDLILSGKLPVDVVHETTTVLAFHHTRPYWPVHVVVIPKRHVPSLLALDPASDLVRECLEVIQIVAGQMLEQHGALGVLTNLGAYQDSKHLHWHLHSGTPLKR
jgi:histidine triad (HIT) family protein